MKAAFAIGLFAALLGTPALGWAAAPISVVAAENFYGDVAQQIGGPAVTVTSVLSNPGQDPHLFEASPSVARSISAARIVVYSGIDYDPWMEKLLAASHSSDRRVIVVAPLAARKAGDNPHVWYDTQTMLAYAAVLTEVLAADDPADAAGFRQRLAQFQTSMQPIQARIGALRERLAGTPVAATEPIFGYMFDALGMLSKNQSFQIAVMNSTEPSASDVAAFEDDLKARRVKLLLYNSQATSPMAGRMEKIAKAAGVPVVGATETEPAGKNYQAWMASALDAIDRALPR
ncbi:MAG TPA: zinc ABC transporter substrate-binding protein [Acetobacteraceae bacterium]|nr:zinc ABC transporter substrate-binding protein [Acetobacteraceae bacterium]